MALALSFGYGSKSKIVNDAYEPRQLALNPLP